MFERIRGHTLYLPGIPPEPMLLDLGANRGEFAREFVRRFGGRGLLVEANPELAAALPHTGAFTSIHAAVTPDEGMVRFHLAANDEGSSWLTLPDRSELGCTHRNTVTVLGRRLDALLAEAKARVDVIKMDIEGAEVAVLKSLDLNALTDVGQMTIEFHCDPIFGFGGANEVEKLLDDLEANGFLCLDFYSQRRLDVLALNLRHNRIPWPRRKLLQLRYRPRPWQKKLKSLLPRRVRR